MAKGTIKAKEVTDYLHSEGFKEIKIAEKHPKWYKKASEKPSCLKESAKKKVRC